jgi:hypothetical protein
MISGLEIIFKSCVQDDDGGEDKRNKLKSEPKDHGHVVFY